jgi:hypothetical protein
MKYLLTLKNGDKREIKILNKPLFPCTLDYEGGSKFLPMADIKASDHVTSFENDDPHYLYQDYIGAIRDEGVMFGVYRGLRNPIIKLELTED